MEGAQKEVFRPGMLREEARKVAAGMLVAAPFLHMSFGFGARFCIALAFSGFLAFLSAVDIRYGMIYDRVLLPMGCAGAVLDFVGFGVGVLDAVFAACLGGGMLLAVRLASRGGMGGGDVKLGFVLGIWLGAERTMLALFLAFLSGAIVASFFMLRDGARGRRMAFGPFLALGAWTAFLYGERILSLYGEWAWG